MNKHIDEKQDFHINNKNLHFEEDEMDLDKEIQRVNKQINFNIE
jgi:hypothetical protein